MVSGATRRYNVDQRLHRDGSPRTMNEIIYSVFVSSTFEDLREERGELHKALLKLKCFPIGMELFPSSDDETWEFIKRQIDQADYYIVVIAGRYGSVGPDGVGYTEMEYDYARSIGKPTIGFIHSDPGKIPADRTETDPKRRVRLDKFKAKVRRSVVTTFSTPHELALQVFGSITGLKDSKPAIGYVRANQTVDPRKYADILEENTRLKEQIGKLQLTEVPFPGADEQIMFDIIITNTDVSPHRKDQITLSATLGDFFIRAVEAMLDGRTLEREIEGILKAMVYQDQLAAHEKADFVEPEVITSIKRKLFSAGLIDVSPGSRGYLNEWSLTDLGRAQYAVLSRLSLRSAGKSDSSLTQSGGAGRTARSGTARH